MAGQEIASFYATIGADVSGFKAGLDMVSDKMQGIGTGMAQMTDAVANGFKVIVLAAGAMAGAVAVTGFQFDAMKEQADIAFTTMLGSGEAAQGMLDELQSFAAKTPFEFPDLIRASQRMMAMGFASQEVIPTLTAVGDAVAALGGGQFEIDRVTTALGQMNAKGKTSAEEMMQLTEAGIPAWQMLADKIGVSVPEAMKMVTAGAIDAKTTINAVTSGIEQRFGGMMAAQSQTFNGLLSNLKDNFTQLSGQVMKPFFDLAKTGLAKVVDITSSPSFTQGIKDFATWGAKAAQQLAGFVQTMMDWGAKVLPPLWENLKIVATAIWDLITPIVSVVGKFMSWKDVLAAVGVVVVATAASIIASMTPIIATFAAITVAMAALRWAWQSDFLSIRTITLDTVQKLSDWFYKESGIWKGTWEATGAYIADRVEYFFKYKIYNLTVGTWSTIREDLKLTWGILKNRAEEWVMHQAAQIKFFANEALGRITNFKDRMLTLWQEWVEPTIKSVRDWYAITDGKIKQWAGNVQNSVRDVRDYIIDKWNGVLDWFHEHIQPMVDRGKAIIQGLWDGIKEKWNAMSSWFSGVWGDLTSKFKHFFGIASPSTLFADYGEDISLGLAKGISGASGAVYDAMDGLTPGLTSNVRLMGEPAATTGAASSTTRIEELLTILIQELRAKNMTANVTVSGGGGNYGDLINFRAGQRQSA